MNVNLNLLRYNKISPLQSFKGEIAEPKNKKDFSDDVFFINMNNYGTNKVWAAKMKRLALDVSKTISQDVVFENVLEQVQDGIYDINGFVYGIRRTVPEFFCIKNTDQRGGEYYERYMDKRKYHIQWRLCRWYSALYYRHIQQYTYGCRYNTT